MEVVRQPEDPDSGIVTFTCSDQGARLNVYVGITGATVEVPDQARGRIVELPGPLETNQFGDVANVLANAAFELSRLINPSAQ